MVVDPVISWLTFSFFQFRTIMNEAAINICMQGFGWTEVFVSLKWIPKSGMATSYSSCMFKDIRNKLFTSMVLVFCILTISLHPSSLMLRRNFNNDQKPFWHQPLCFPLPGWGGGSAPLKSSQNFALSFKMKNLRESWIFFLYLSLWLLI